MHGNKIAQGFATFVSDGTVPFGAVRDVAPGGRDEFLIYVENAGEFVVPMDAVEAVHFEKVIIQKKLLSRELRDAISHAHDAEDA
jgi:hypothetical protein